MIAAAASCGAAERLKRTGNHSCLSKHTPSFRLLKGGAPRDLALAAARAEPTAPGWVAMGIYAE